MSVAHKNTIAQLASLFPKTFFEEARQRRPLKHDIVKDIESLGCNDLIGVDVDAAVDFYISHVGYQIHLSTPGTMRIDLDGNQVSRVTEQEARIAQQTAAKINEARKTRAPAPLNGSEPSPPNDRMIAVRKAAIAEQKRAGVPPTELLASAAKKLGRATSLLDSDDDDEFRSRFVETVLMEVKADIDAVIARL
jgi:sRNA-binding protein